MSGTRKMEKFELDAFIEQKKREASPAPPPEDKQEEEEDPRPSTPGEWIPPQLEESAPLALTTKRDDLAKVESQWDDADAPILADGPPPSPLGGVDASLDLPKTEERPPPAKSAPSLRSEPPASERRASHAPLRPPAKSDPSWHASEPSIEIATNGKKPPTERELAALRTRLAAKFVTLADQVTEAFGEFSIGAGAWAVELTAPTGMSTGGGKQALQHLRLRPRRPGYPVILAGTVNQVEKSAELRDYGHASLAHELRFRSALEITPQEWEQLLRKAEVVLGNAQVKVTRTPPSKELLAQKKVASKVSPGAIAALVVVLLLAVIVLWRVALALLAESS